MSDIVKTPPTTLVPNPPTPLTLDELAQRIKTELYLISNVAKDFVARAMDVGDLLNKAQNTEGHGNWGQWLEKNCGLSDRSARRYMRMADNRQMLEEEMKKKSATVADLTIRKAELLITNQSKGSAKQNSSSKSAASQSLSPVAGVGNDPLSAVKGHQDKLFKALKDLRRNDEGKARDAASAIVRHLEEVDLYVIA